MSNIVFQGSLKSHLDTSLLIHCTFILFIYSLIVEKIGKLSEDLKEVKKPCGNTDIKDWNVKVVNLEKINFELRERQQEIQSECDTHKQKAYEVNCCNESLETSNSKIQHFFYCIKIVEVFIASIITTRFREGGYEIRKWPWGGGI